MNRDPIDRYAMERLAGLALGIPIGAILGPIVFGAIGLKVVAGAALGSLTGALIGYFVASLLIRKQRRRVDREIIVAASAMRVQRGLPNTIWITVKNAHVTLYGEVGYEAQRGEAERAFAAIPGVKRVTNRLRFAPPAAA